VAYFYSAAERRSRGALWPSFAPARIKYTVLISTAVATAAGVTLANNYTWQFVTGVLNLTIPPMQQPGPAQVGRIPQGRPPDLAAVVDQQRPAPGHHRGPEHSQKPTRQHSVRHPYPHLTRCIVAHVKTPSSDPLPEIVSGTLFRPVLAGLLAGSGPVLDPGS